MDRGWGCASSTCGHIVAYMYVFRLSSLEAGQRDDTDFVKWQEEMKQASLFVWCVCVCVCVCMYVWCVCERDPHPEVTLTLMLPCVHMYVCVCPLPTLPLCSEELQQLWQQLKGNIWSAKGSCLLIWI